MAGNLPRVFSGASCQYPVSRSVSFDTGVQIAQNGAEQRWRRRGPLTGFTLQYQNISLADKQKLDNFIAAQKGAFDSSWTFHFTAQNIIPNGHFTQGLSGWVSDNPSQFATVAVPPFSWSDVSESAVVNVNNRSVTIPANSRIAQSVYQSTNIPVTYGNTYSLQYGAAIVGNSSIPAGVSMEMQVYVRQLDANGNYLDILLADYHGSLNWGIYPTQFTATMPDVASCIVVFAQILTNTTNASVGISASASAYVFGQVEMNLLGPNTTTAYTNCAFDQDEFVWTQNKNMPNRWNGSVKFRQTASSSSNFGVPVSIPNANFAQGFTSWTQYNPTNGFQLLWQSGQTPGVGITSLWALNQTQTLTQGAASVMNFGSSAIPAQYGQTFQFTYWSIFQQGGAFPSGGVFGWKYFQFIFLDASSNLLATDTTSWSRLNTGDSGGWKQGSTTVTITSPGTASLIIAFVGIVTNPTSSSLTFPYNCCNMAIGQVSGQVIGSSAFPSVRSGIVTGFPYTPGYRYFTDRNDLPAGPRIGYGWYGTGLTNFPSRSLNTWGLQFTNVSDADLGLIENHFRGASGRYQGFTFTDPDTGVIYPNVRYDMDALDISHKSINANDFKVLLTEYWV